MNRGQPCIFDEAERRVLVSERRLHELQRRATVAQHDSPTRDQSTPTQTPSRRVEAQQAGSLIDATVSYIPTLDQGQATDVQGGNLQVPAITENVQQSTHLRAQSPQPFIWILIQDVCQYLTDVFGENGNARLGEQSSATYAFSLSPEPSTHSSCLGIPPKAHLQHLAQVATFHLNVIYTLFDDSAFEEQWNRAQLQSANTQPGIWQVKLLMVTGFGKLFLEKGATSFGPPGIQEFLQCVKAMPTITGRIQDPFTTMETLCLMALYAQSADLHTAAHLYIGQASRLARCFGVDSSAEESKDQTLWRNICVLDQRLSATINASPDSYSDQQNFSLTASHQTSGPGPDYRLRASLSIANILTGVTKAISNYERTNTMSLDFVTAISQHLTTLAATANSIRATEPLCYDQSLATISRSAATLHLLYCHCVMRASQPFLLHLIRLHASNGQIEGNLPFDTAAPSEPMLSMLKVAINAATLSLSVISALREQSMLETFVFLDSEVTVLAAILLVLANIIMPGTTDSSFSDVANDVLQDMKSRGNVPAAALKDEFARVCRLAIGYSLTSTPTYAELFHSQLTVVKDAETLNDAILNVIELPQVTAERAGDSAGGGHEPLVPELATGFQRALPPSQPGEAPSFVISDQVPTTFEDTQLPSASADFYNDQFDLVGDPFDLNMTELDWLDLL